MSKKCTLANMRSLRWYKLEIEIPPEEEFIVPVTVAGKKLCLIRHEGKLYLTQRSCPHAGGQLSGGWCKDGMLICPLHRYGYNLENGRGAEGQGDYIDIYPLKVDNDGLYGGIKESLFKRFFGS